MSYKTRWLAHFEDAVDAGYTEDEAGRIADERLRDNTPARIAPSRQEDRTPAQPNAE